MTPLPTSPRPSRETHQHRCGRRHDVHRRCTLEERCQVASGPVWVASHPGLLHVQKARPPRRVASRLSGERKSACLHADLSSSEAGQPADLHTAKYGSAMTRANEPTDARPLTVRIADDIRARIESGAYSAGMQLPTLDDLAVEYGCSLAAVRAALDLLRQQGLVITRQGRGSFVRDVTAARRRITRGRAVTRDPRRGYVFPAAARPDEPWAAHGQPRAATVPVPAAVAEVLGVPPNAEVLRRRRVTSPVGEPPFQLVDTWIHPDAVADAPQVAEPDTGPGGYLDRLEEAGHGPLSWTETIRIRTPSREEARLLEIPPSLPVLDLTRVGRSARTARPVEATVCVIPSDRVEIVSELDRDPTAHWPTTPVERP